jgi:hypothetical protein
MDLFPKEILAMATRNRTVGSTAVVGSTSFELVSEINARQTIQSIPGREKYLLLLALLATSKGRLSTTDLERRAKDSSSNQSTDQVAFLSKLLERHGHSSTVTIAAIQAACQSPYFDKAIFNPAREEDPQFWALLWNFGRPRMPASVFAPYALFEAERRIGAPIKDFAKIAALLNPGTDWEAP